METAETNLAENVSAEWKLLRFGRWHRENEIGLAILSQGDEVALLLIAQEDNRPVGVLLNPEGNRLLSNDHLLHCSPDVTPECQLPRRGDFHCHRSTYFL